MAQGAPRLSAASRARQSGALTYATLASGVRRGGLTPLSLGRAPLAASRDDPSPCCLFREGLTLTEMHTDTTACAPEINQPH